VPSSLSLRRSDADVGNHEDLCVVPYMLTGRTLFMVRHAAVLELNHSYKV
jgi:hypothetical protein